VILLNMENGRLGEVTGNSNHTVDIGPMQVNASWLPKLAAHWKASKEETYRALRDEVCANIEGGRGFSAKPSMKRKATCGRASVFIIPIRKRTKRTICVRCSSR